MDEATPGMNPETPDANPAEGAPETPTPDASPAPEAPATPGEGGNEGENNTPGM